MRVVDQPGDKPIKLGGPFMPDLPIQDKALRVALLSLPQGIYIGANRYDTDDTHTLHLWNDKGESFDIRVARLESEK